MSEKWRPAFIGTFNPRAHEFIKAANLTLAGDVASISSKEQIKTSAEIFFSKIPPEKREQEEGVWLITDFPSLIIDSAQLLIAEGNAGKAEKEFFPKLIVVELDASVNSVRQDEATRIRVAQFTKRMVAHPIHPTPDS